MNKLLLILITFGVLSCQVFPPIPIEPEGTSSCPAACENMSALGCPEGSDLEDGTTCLQFCIETQESGHALNPQCLKDVQTCEEIQTKCGQ